MDQQVTLKDELSQSQELNKLTAKIFGPLEVTKFIVMNVVKLDLPDHFKIHPIMHMSHTPPF